MYAPTAKAEERERLMFNESLSVAQNQDKQKWSNQIVIVGDFNSQVGIQEAGESNVVGKYGYGRRDEAGQLLVSFLSRARSISGKYFFKRRAGKKWTWISPNHLVKNEIDYALVKNINIIK